MKESSPSKEHSLHYDFTFRLVPGVGDPIVIEGSGGHSRALHPAHLNDFQNGFAEMLDYQLRNHVLIEVNALIDKRRDSSKQDRSSAGNNAPGTTSSADGDRMLGADEMLSRLVTPNFNGPAFSPPAA